MRTLPEDVLIALNAAPGIGRAAVCRLARDDGGSSAAAGPVWLRRRRVDDAQAARLGVPRKALERAVEVAGDAPRRADRERRRARRAQAEIVTLGSAAYPPMLLHLPLPPPVLYVRGELPEAPAIAMVGARRASPYGLEVADLLSRGLAAEGLTVVSGFARGVDAAAHRGALAAGGATVAVLGCGIDVAYPRAHRRLAAETAAAGALVSELPCGTQPRPWHFPVRNRIIAALALGTVVVEAAVRSGSLITARHAMELGRDVLAVPGRIFDERAMGPNSLIADGAVVVRHPRDAVRALAWPSARLGIGGEEESAERAEGAGDRPEPPPDLPARQCAVLAELDRSSPRSGEELARATGLALDAVLAALLELELACRARRCPGPAWTRLGAG